jgi:hypothetical protein
VERGIRRISGGTPRWSPPASTTIPVLRGARIQLAARVREELLDAVASVSLA